MIKVKILSKEPKLDLQDVVHLHNREYSIFTMSACVLALEIINKKWAQSCFKTVIAFHRGGVMSMFRSQREEDRFERLMAKILTEDTPQCRQIFSSHIAYAQKLERLFKEIEKKQIFAGSFVKKFNEAFGYLTAYVIAIHRGLEYIPDKRGFGRLRNRLIRQRTKYEYLMGAYEEYLSILCSKVAKNRNIPSPRLLKTMTGDEFAHFLDTNKLPRGLAQRDKGTALLLLPRYSLLSGKPAEVLFKKLQKQHKELHRNLLGVKSIMGTPVYRKKVRGMVQVIVSPNDFSSFKRGKILVTVTTLPKYTHIISTAKAIIADEGTLLSHAAIISRELKIPAIVGTKIATQILKDGDRVEVDAFKGIVRKV